MPEMDCSFSRKQSLNASAEDICSALGLPDIVVPRLVNSPLPLQCLAAEALPDEMKREIQVITDEYVSPQQEQSSETTDLELQSEPSCVLRLNECINECMALVQSDANAQEIIVPKRLFLNGSGMRLVGGVRCQHTGNIHARILASQEFHQDGIHLKDGMCVLAWDEFPLEGSTFEEVRRLVKSTSSSHITLMVKDCKTPVWYPPSTPTHPSPEPSKPTSGSPDHLSIPKKRPRHISIPDRSPREQSPAVEENGEQGKRKKKVLPISLPFSTNVVQEDFTTQPLNGMVQLSLRYQTARGLLHITLHKVKGRSGTPIVGGDNPSGAFLNTYIFPDVRSQGVKYARPVQSTSSTEEILERSAEYSLPEEEVQRTNLRVIVWESKKKTFKGEVFLNIGNTEVVNLHGVPQWYTICPPDPNLPALPSPFVEQKQGVDTLLNKMKSQTQSLYFFTLRRTKKIGLGTIKGSSLGELPSVSSLKDSPRLSDLPKILETLKDPKPKQAIASLSPSQKTNMYDLLARIGELVDKDTQHRKSSSLIKGEEDEEDSCHRDSIALREASPCSSEENMENFDTVSLLNTLGILARPEGANGSGQEDTAFRNCVAQLSTALESLREEEKTPREDKVCRFLYSMEDILNDDSSCDGEKQGHQKLFQGCKSQQLALLSLLASLNQSSACDQIEPATSSTTTLGSGSSSVFTGENSNGLPVWVESQVDVDSPSSSLGLPVIRYSSASWNSGPRHIVSRPCLKRYSFMDRLERMNIEFPVVPKNQQGMLCSSWESPLYDRLLPQKQNRQSLPPLSQENSLPVHNLLVQPTSYGRNRSKSLNNVCSDEPDGAVSVCRDDSDTDSSESLDGNHTTFCDDPLVMDPDEGDGESSLDFVGCRRGLTYSCGPLSHSLPQPVSATAHQPIRTSASLGSGLLSRWKSAEILFRPPKRNKPQQKSKFPLTWGRSSTSVVGKMQAYGKGKAIGKMKVQLSANEPSSQVTVKMLDIEFEGDTLMNANYEIKVSLYNKITDRCEDSQDAAMSLKRCGRLETKLMPNTLHFSTQSMVYALQITMSPTEKGFARKKRSYHIWTDLSNMLEQRNSMCSWMKICKVPS